MSEEQFERLLAILERIAVALEKTAGAEQPSPRAKK